MTNNYFTSGGKQLALATGIHLWDRDWIIGQINQLSEIEKNKVSREQHAYVYYKNGKKKMEKGLWPYQYAAEIDIEYFKYLPNVSSSKSDVIGLPLFPKSDPHTLKLDSIIVIETSPFDYQADAQLFSQYAEKHFKAKTWVEPRDGKYFVAIQAHVYSIQSNYREEGHYEL